MSLESWEKEFYPVEAAACEREAALKHSILKWTGLLQENLTKHKLQVIGLRLYEEGNFHPVDSPRFSVTGDTCALCYWYAERPNEDNQTYEECSECPLFTFRGGVSCAETRIAMEVRSPFAEWDLAKNPLPMLELLKKVEAAQ